MTLLPRSRKIQVLGCVLSAASLYILSLYFVHVSLRTLPTNNLSYNNNDADALIAPAPAALPGSKGQRHEWRKARPPGEEPDKANAEPRRKTHEDVLSGQSRREAGRWSQRTLPAARTSSQEAGPLGTRLGRPPNDNDPAANANAAAAALPSPLPIATALLKPKARLGNQMFQYAALLGIVALNNHSHVAAFPAASLLSATFPITYARDVSSEGFRTLRERHFGSYDPRLEALPKRDVALSGFFQSWRYFHHIRPTIRREFSFREQVKRRARSLLYKYTEVESQEGGAKRVGVHVRRRDMLGFGPRKGYRVPSLSYIRKASEHFRRKYGDGVVFLVVSDDAEWCRDNMQWEGFVVADDLKPEIHLALLTLCDHVIMTSGTFGWWGGYLAGGDVIYYANQIVPNTSAALGLKMSDYYLPQWVGIGD